MAEIQVISGFIQQQNPGSLRQRASQGDPLSFATGQGRPTACRQIGDRCRCHRLVDRLRGPVPSARPGPDVRNPPQRHHISDREIQIGAGVLLH